MNEVIFWSIWGILGGIMFFYYLRRRHRIRSFLVGAGSGILALLLVHYGGSFIGYVPSLNLLHLLQSVILGVPGVILMTVLHYAL